ncbi:MAG: hypothetical protein J0H74_21085 [Chitinophagaceae bacterium]|nr:hypothetical protein [Chitinophagaceae bacterium]
MKKLLLSLFLLPFAKMGPTNSVEIRGGKWPISFESSGNAYLLIFRDQQVMMEEVYDTVEFVGRKQLVYLDSALSVLKRGNDGDEANFSTYSVKRADKKFDGRWYILRTKYSSTNFRQQEADVISKTIRGF